MKPVIERVYLTEIPHKGGTITFQYPSFRRTYGSLAEQIDAEGLGRPTSAQTASLVHDVLKNPKGEYESKIFQILKDFWFVEFTGNLYLPKHEGEEIHNGVIIEDNPTIQKGRLVMNKKALTERLKAGDSNVRFVPFGYSIGEQSTYTLAKNPYIVARYGEEGADKIANLASRYKLNPKVWSFESVNSKVARMSVLLVSNRDFGGSLHVDGDGRIDYYYCLAFGVKK